MSLTLYGIPTCGTVKKARKWLHDRGVDHTFVDFREHPPSQAKVDAWVQAFGAKAMRNTSGGAYRALGDEKKTWDDTRWSRAFASDPMLIKRPIIERDGAPTRVGFRASDEVLTQELMG
ncbi:MAG: Spx/MgsR family RNA polymerase-binding regulatory protein [Deltaproteobacteria bacterium]|nr:MAG: Spx/MgsR family RNA polymerase-binding regulatory protein [Deltaproteobacteria bacterium]